MATRVIPVDPVRPGRDGLDAAAAVLRAEGVVAFPTETFYGLAAGAWSARAVARVFTVKGRPETKAVLVLVDSIAMAESLAREVSATARALMETHWPGALTLVLPAAPGIPESITAGTATIGVRWSPHPVATGLVRALGGPVTAPSANPTDLPPARTPEEVLGYFDGAVDLLLAGGPTPGLAPSTVLDVTVDPPRVLRQGAVVVAVDRAG